MSMNKFLGSGNLTGDPDVKLTQAGKKLAKFRLAINDKYTSASGNTVEKTHYVNCTAFGTTAEIIGKYCRKGQRIEVEGKLDYSEWTDEETEQRRSSLGVIVQQVYLMPKAMNPKGSPAKEEQPGYTEEPGEAVLNGAKSPSGEDDIPF